MIDKDSSLYENRHLVYLDILGFKEMINRSEVDDSQLQKIVDALNTSDTFQRTTEHVRLELSGAIEKVRKKRLENGLSNEGWPDTRDFTYEWTMFSDTILLSAPATDFGIAFLIRHASAFLSRMLSMGIMLRGAITSGHLYHKGGTVFGPALVEAYLLESKVSRYPRILISSAVKGYLQDLPEELKLTYSPLREDFDGLEHLDVLRVKFHGNPQDGEAILRAVYHELYWVGCDSRGLDVQSKHGWYRKYFYEFLDQCYPELERTLREERIQIMTDALMRSVREPTGDEAN